eukprot:CAMPEP_0117447990 /NCGR_PEP_ID=MMETSP0759-20121206/7161_1 /TAXON_ID=63605 /ORGANISM="Percolomonas cosmopolitus, Strain WS" /LENGTH=84 /DNA_ID=CAMNT_0005240345 /DNA_START=56 /DNA_END=310 /DNA_ORIENTATION=+
MQPQRKMKQSAKKLDKNQKAKQNVKSKASMVNKQNDNIGLGHNPLIDHTSTVTETVTFGKNPEQQKKLRKCILKETIKKSSSNE